MFDAVEVPTETDMIDAGDLADVVEWSAACGERRTRRGIRRGPPG